MPIFQFIQNHQRYIKLAGLALVVIGIPIVIVGVQNTHQTTQQAADDTNTQIATLTNQLVAANKRTNPSTGGRAQSGAISKENLSNLGTMVAVARTRKELLQEQIQKDPEGFLKNATLAESKNSFPDQVQPYLEENVTIPGTVQHIHKDDFKTQKSEDSFLLLTKPLTSSQFAPTDTYTLYAQDPSKTISAGPATVHGVALGQNIAVGQTTNATATNPTLGDQKTLVLLVNFQNDPQQPYSVDSINTLFFGTSNSVSNFFQESSFGQVSLSGSANGWYTIDANPATCTYTDMDIWAAKANAIASSRGIDTSMYKRFVYIFPYYSVGSCLATESGIAELGVTPSHTWIFAFPLNPNIYEHELGHNLGIMHAGKYTCPAKAIDTYSNCLYNDYGDSYDAMGGPDSQRGQYDIPHKYALGWIPISHIQTVNQNGTYTIAPLETNTDGVHGLKIAKLDTHEYYYLEYRQPIGVDSYFQNTSIVKGVSIHIWNDLNFTSTKLIDLTPTTPYDLDDALSDNGSFVDPVNNITITQLSHDSSAATVNITFSTPQPTSTPTPIPTTMPTPTVGQPPDLYFKVNPLSISISGQNNQTIPAFTITGIFAANWEIIGNPTNIPTISYSKTIGSVSFNQTIPISIVIGTTTPSGVYNGTVVVQNRDTLANVQIPITVSVQSLTPMPTSTPLPTPTNTPIPTQTPTPIPTHTPIPTSTPTPTPTPTYSITGKLFVDANQNGVEDSTELGYPNAPVHLNGTKTKTVTTNQDGYFRFDLLPSGNYTLSIDYLVTNNLTPRNVTLGPSTAVNFALVPVSTPIPPSPTKAPSPTPRPLCVPQCTPPPLWCRYVATGEYCSCGKLDCSLQYLFTR